MNATIATDRAPTENCYCANDLSVDLGRRCVKRNGVDLALTGLSFDLLAALLLAAPDFVTVNELMNQVWPGLVVGPDTVSQRIKRVRQALGDDAAEPRYIAGVRGRGYRWIAPVTRVPSHSIPLTVGVSPVVPASSNIVKTAAALAFNLSTAALLIVLIIAGAGVWWALASMRPAASVAVLPFTNLTGDASKDYLGDGIADEIINSLTKIPGLSVPARTSSFAYKGRHVDIRHIAKDLGVGAILEGSVLESSEHIRVTAQLISAKSGLHIWSQSFNEQNLDFFKLQDNIATGIAQALRVNSNSAGKASFASEPYTQDVEAYQLYLRGLSLVDRGSEDALSQALQDFSQALAHDPQFARPYAGIADSYIGQYQNGMPFQIASAERAARQALTLDPNVPYAHDALAFINVVQGHWIQMESNDRAALSVNANDGVTHARRANHLSYVGKLREAVEQIHEAYALSPASAEVVSDLAALHSLTGTDGEAIKFAKLAEALGYPRTAYPLPQTYATVAIRARHYSEAARDLLGVYQHANSDSDQMAGVFRLIFDAMSDPLQRGAALQAYPDHFIQQRPLSAPDFTSNGVACNTPPAYVLLGAIDIAYELANRCLDWISPATDGPGGVISNGWLWTAEMRPFRQDRRFQAFTARLGMLEYWRQNGPPDQCDLHEGSLRCH